MLVEGYKKFPMIGKFLCADECKKSIMRIKDIIKIEKGAGEIKITSDTLFIGEVNEYSFSNDSLRFEIETNDKEEDIKIVESFCASNPNAILEGKVRKKRK